MTPMPFERGFGAMPPPDMEWMLGRTVATIRFVQDCERYLEESDHPEADRVVIRSALKAIKANPRANLSKFLTVDEYLKVPELPGT